MQEMTHAKKSLAGRSPLRTRSEATGRVSESEAVGERSELAGASLLGLDDRAGEPADPRLAVARKYGASFDSMEVIE